MQQKEDFVYQSEQPVLNSPTWFKKLTMILTSVLLLIMFGVGGYWLGAKQRQSSSINLLTKPKPSWLPSATPAQQLSPIFTSPSNGSAPTTDWKTYRNEEYGFEVKHPMEVFAQESSEGVAFSVHGRKCETMPHCPTFMAIAPIRIPSNATVTADTSLEELIQLDIYLPEFKEFRISSEVADRGGIDIDVVEKVIFERDIQGYRVHRWGQATGECIYFAKHGNKSIRIWRNQVGLTYTLCDNDPLFNHMISTFRFIK